MAINDQLERIIASLDDLVNSGEAKSEYGLSIEDRLLRIAEQLKKIKEEGGIGGKGFTIHICSATEYDAVTRIPTITDPDLSTIYLVPTSNASANLFDEYIFVDGAWELFGSSPAYVDITPTATVTKSGNTATITITDKNGTTTATISDGTNGTNGADGAPGVGVPIGGTTGQVLVKKTSTNYDTEWQTPSSSGDYVPRDQHGYNANKYLKVDEDGYVIPVFPSLSDCDRVEIDEVGAIIGDAIVLTYNSTGDWVWSNIPLVFECDLAESDFGGSTTYTYLNPFTRRDENDIEFMLINGSRIMVYDQISTSPVMFSVGYTLLNDGASDDHAQLLYEVWFIDMTQGSNPLVVRKFRKTYIQGNYYYVEVT